MSYFLTKWNFSDKDYEEWMELITRFPNYLRLTYTKEYPGPGYTEVQKCTCIICFNRTKLKYITSLDGQNEYVSAIQDEEGHFFGETGFDGDEHFGGVWAHEDTVYTTGHGLHGITASDFNRFLQVFKIPVNNFLHDFLSFHRLMFIIKHYLKTIINTICSGVKNFLTLNMEKLWKMASL